jgi:hypothetical protein
MQRNDHVIGGLTDIAERMAAALGRTYHLVSGAPVPVAPLRTLALGYQHLHAPRFRSAVAGRPDRGADTCARSAPADSRPGTRGHAEDSWRRKTSPGCAGSDPRGSVGPVRDRRWPLPGWDHWPVHQHLLSDPPGDSGPRPYPARKPLREPRPRADRRPATICPAMRWHLAASVRDSSLSKRCAPARVGAGWDGPG